MIVSDESGAAMAFYYTIDNETESGRRTARNLLALKRRLAEEIPRRTVTDTLLLATWNIREFDSPKYGTRTNEAFHYIAEIVSHFDLVAIQEVRDDLTALKQLQYLLGDQTWDYVLTDVTEGTRGNRERMAFLYDAKKVRFGGLAGEVVLPESRTAAGIVLPRQLARSPFLVGFQVGWFKFMLCTVHVLYGTATAEDPDRLEEIKNLSGFLVKRVKDRHAWAKNLILLGDFNIFRPTDVTLGAISDAGFIVPEQIQRLPSNAARNKHYDQIAFWAPHLERQLATLEAGVFNFYELLFRPEDQETYVASMGQAYEKKTDGAPRDAAGKKRYYGDWRTYQLSDHLPMWVELKIDFGVEYLGKKSEPPS
jgi:endonuclease/exonuclease/phosphatase family metal-dependent hydrolase